jgi:hypothetical protein
MCDEKEKRRLGNQAHFNARHQQFQVIFVNRRFVSKLRIVAPLLVGLVVHRIAFNDCKTREKTERFASSVTSGAANSRIFRHKKG